MGYASALAHLTQELQRLSLSHPIAAPAPSIPSMPSTILNPSTPCTAQLSIAPSPEAQSDSTYSAGLIVQQAHEHAHTMHTHFEEARQSQAEAAKPLESCAQLDMHLQVLLHDTKQRLLGGVLATEALASPYLPRLYASVTTLRALARPLVKPMLHPWPASFDAATLALEPDRGDGDTGGNSLQGNEGDQGPVLGNVASSSNMASSSNKASSSNNMSSSLKINILFSRLLANIFDACFLPLQPRHERLAVELLGALPTKDGAADESSHGQGDGVATWHGQETWHDQESAARQAWEVGALECVRAIACVGTRAVLALSARLLSLVTGPLSHTRTRALSHVHAQAHASMRTCIHTHTLFLPVFVCERAKDSACICIRAARVWVRACVWVRARACVCVCARASLCVHTHTHTHTHAQTHTLTHTRTHAHTHTHTHSHTYSQKYTAVHVTNVCGYMYTHTRTHT